ncbi:hypothetical protein RC54_17660 [Herbaspirillum rubrisubalbicans]|uniref:Uncharacterized protein n=1 Tax=Herbaspirillum rubrisubalbicans TaxID=80842 RepID=A0AAD0XI70_9BURK|nr:hypothetical protein RC54_17660 [Herbaspirillum rubrisubalbicans]
MMFKAQIGAPRQGEGRSGSLQSRQNSPCDRRACEKYRQMAMPNVPNVTEKRSERALEIVFETF